MSFVKITLKALKRLYRKHFLRRLLSLNEDKVEVVLSFFKLINITEYFAMYGCRYVTFDCKDGFEQNLKKLQREQETSLIDMDLTKLMINTHICKECDADDMRDWLTCDSHHHVFQIISDEEISGNVLRTNEQPEMQDEENVDANNEAAFK